MKTAAIIVLIILFIVSLSANVWYFTETTNLNQSLARQLGRGYSTGYQLPPDTISQLKSGYGRLISASEQLQRQNQVLTQECSRLQAENRRYEATLTQIRREAEQAQQFQLFSGLLKLIFALF